MTYEQLAEKWLDAVQRQKNVDYGDSKSVREYNRCTDLYRKMARQIDEKYRDRLDSFAEFLNAEDVDTRVACAFCLLELTHYPMEIEERALEIIRERAENAWDGMGYSFWLENWENGMIATQYASQEN